MSTRKTRGAAAKRHGSSADIREEENGDDDTDTRSDFESFVREQFKKILEGQKELQSEVRSLEENLEKNVLLLESRLEKLEKKNEDVEAKVVEFQRDADERIKYITQKLKATEGLVEELQLKTNKLERFSRWNNVRIIGRKVVKGENCLTTVGKILHEKFGLDRVKIERAHPDGPKSKSDGDGTPQHILFKLNSYQDKISIMKVARVKLKNEGYYFTDDLTTADLQEKRKWRDQVREAYGKGLKYRFFNGLWRDDKGKPVRF
ncbi:hypothetical protein Bbelb_377540 [Branchiostoma belcheri]|nr:hypothetical protein Bbelb_377540 [Branchiostoma belcheri]